MYNKIFSKIVDSSIWMEDIHVRLVWMMFLAIMDEDGFVHLASVKNVAHKARIELELAEQAIRILESPDPESSNPNKEGRRIERVPGGWIVNNAEEYKKIVRREDRLRNTRERVRKHYQKNKANADLTHPNADLTTSVSVSVSVSEEDKRTQTGIDSVIELREEKYKEITNERVYFAGKPPESLVRHDQGLDDPMLDFDPDRAAEARLCYSEYHFRRFGSLPNLSSEATQRDLREIAAAIEAFPGAYESIMSYLKAKPPKGHTRTIKVFQMLKYLGFDLGDRVSPPENIKAKEESARLQEIIRNQIRKNQGDPS